MRSVMEVCLVGAILLCGAGAQDSQRPLTKGVSVQMPVAGHAVEMRAADEPNAKVVAITAEGKVYVGIEATEPAALSNLSEGTIIYVKADSRVPYQKVLTVLDALRGRSVVLLTATPENAPRQQGYLPPYGMTLIVSR
jgi:hypothetical protein